MDDSFSIWVWAENLKQRQARGFMKKMQTNGLSKKVGCNKMNF